MEAMTDTLRNDTDSPIPGSTISGGSPTSTVSLLGEGSSTQKDGIPSTTKIALGMISLVGIAFIAIGYLVDLTDFYTTIGISWDIATSSVSTTLSEWTAGSRITMTSWGASISTAAEPAITWVTGNPLITTGIVLLCMIVVGGAIYVVRRPDEEVIDEEKGAIRNSTGSSSSDGSISSSILGREKDKASHGITFTNIAGASPQELSNQVILTTTSTSTMTTAATMATTSSSSSARVASFPIKVVDDLIRQLFQRIRRFNLEIDRIGKEIQSTSDQAKRGKLELEREQLHELGQADHGKYVEQIQDWYGYRKQNVILGCNPDGSEKMTTLVDAQEQSISISSSSSSSALSSLAIEQLQTEAEAWYVEGEYLYNYLTELKSDLKSTVQDNSVIISPERRPFLERFREVKVQYEKLREQGKRLLSQKTENVDNLRGFDIKLDGAPFKSTVALEEKIQTLYEEMGYITINIDDLTTQISNFPGEDDANVKNRLKLQNQKEELERTCNTKHSDYTQLSKELEAIQIENVQNGYNLDGSEIDLLSEMIPIAL